MRVRRSGGAYVASCGGKRASSTQTAWDAAKRAAAKALGCSEITARLVYMHEDAEVIAYEAYRSKTTQGETHE